MENANRKKAKLLQLSVDGMIIDADFKKMMADANREIAQAEQVLRELDSQQAENEEYKKKVDSIRKTLAAAQRDAASGIISKEFVERYIDKIFVTPEEDGALRLDVRIFTGETASKILEEKEGRTGHMFKRMIEQQERQMSGK